MAKEKSVKDITLFEKALESNRGLVMHNEDILAALANCPSVDTAELVRCKQCRYYKEIEKRCDHPCLDFDVECYDHWLEMEPDDFCSYGERREGE